MRLRMPILFVATVLVAVAAGAQTLLEVVPAAEKSVYRLGEPVRIQVEACSPLSEPYSEQLYWFVCLEEPGCFYCTSLQIVDSDGALVAQHTVPGVACPSVPLQVSWQAHECKTLVLNDLWPQVEGGFPAPGDGDAVPPGTYRVRLEWQDGTFFESPPFVITDVALQAPVPTTTWFGIGLLVVLVAVAGMALILRR